VSVDSTRLGSGEEGEGARVFIGGRGEGDPAVWPRPRARFLFLGEVAAGGEEEEEGRNPEKGKKKRPRGRGETVRNAGGARAQALARGGVGWGGVADSGAREFTPRGKGERLWIGPGPRTSAWEGSGLRPFGPAACCVRRARVTVGQQRVPVCTVGPRGVENSRLVTRFALLPIPRHWRTGWGRAWCLVQVVWNGRGCGARSPVARARGVGAWRRCLSRFQLCAV
jgi:hypothetical protein